MSKLGLTAADMHQKCAELFGGRPPVEFKSRPTHKLDAAISEVLVRSGSTIPIVNVGGPIYLIGIYKFSCSLRDGQVIIQNEQGESELLSYLDSN